MLIREGSLFISSLKNDLCISKKNLIDLSVVDAIVNKLDDIPTLINEFIIIHTSICYLVAYYRFWLIDEELVIVLIVPG